MACSRFEYVKNFETNPTLLPNCWIVVRIDGRSFTKFTALHEFEKPNDIRGLQLMNHCAKMVMEEFNDIVIALGQSDEYSFVMNRETSLFSRRVDKIISSVVSLFTGCYVHYWSTYFPGKELKKLPAFDGRAVCYPSDQNVKDYLAWRQVDCHINNLYNTLFWALVKDGTSTTDAEKILMDTVSADKNEILFNRFDINYNNLPDIYRRSSILMWKEKDRPVHTQVQNHDQNTVTDDHAQSRDTTGHCSSNTCNNIDDNNDINSSHNNNNNGDNEYNANNNDNNMSSMNAHTPNDSGNEKGVSSSDHEDTRNENKAQDRSDNTEIKRREQERSNSSSSSSSNTPETKLPTNSSSSSSPSSASEANTSQSSQKRRLDAGKKRAGKRRQVRYIAVIHEDLIAPKFWMKHPNIVPYFTPTEIKKRERKRKKLAYKSKAQAPQTKAGIKNNNGKNNTNNDNGMENNNDGSMDASSNKPGEVEGGQ